jgi:ubiquitin-protein ligase
MRIEFFPISLILSPQSQSLNPTTMSTVRLRRLQSDYERLCRFLQRQPRIRLIQFEGNPPERYQLEYQIKSLRQVDEQLQVVASHMVEVALPLGYPRMPPQCRMLTPIFHPNIAPHAICIGDHWSPGEPLWSMVARIGEIIAYQSYNTQSPLNGEAARWVDQNLEKLPLDPVNLFVEEPAPKPKPVPPPVKTPAPMKAPPLVKTAPPVMATPPIKTTTPVMATPPRKIAPAVPSAPRPAPDGRPLAAAPAESAAAIIVTCSCCQKRYRVPAGAAGKWLRCKNCQTLIPVPAAPAPP